MKASRSVTSVLTRPIRDFAGELLAPGDPAYDDARRVQNAAIDRRPALIARCAGPGTTSPRRCATRASRAARHGPRRRPRAGRVRGRRRRADDRPLAHARASTSIRCAARARVQGGATWRDARRGDAGARPRGHRRAHPVGRRRRLHARLRLGLARAQARPRRRLAALGARRDRRPASIVTASADEHPDLFWALRGGGPGFGVVVELEFALAPVGPQVLGGMLGWPVERAAEVAAAYTELMAGAPDDLGGGLALLDAPPAPFVRRRCRARRSSRCSCCGPARREEGEAVLRPLRELGAGVRRRRPDALRRAAGRCSSGPPRCRCRRASQVERRLPRGLPSEAVIAAAEARGGGRRRWDRCCCSRWAAPSRACPRRRRRSGAGTRRGICRPGPPGSSPPTTSRAGRGRRRAAGACAVVGGESYPNFIPDVDPERLRAATRRRSGSDCARSAPEWDPDDVFGAGHAIPLHRLALVH